MFKHILVVVAALVIVGCASPSPYNYVRMEKTTSFTENGVRYTKADIGSAVQWNEDYVVTAKHVDYVDGIEYKCGEGCDLQFVKKKAKGPIPQWRERVANENVTIVGTNMQKRVVVAKGKDLDIYTTSNKNTNTDVYLSTAVTEGGMSGGPVFGDDFKVVGILTGATNGTDVEGNKVPELVGKGDAFSIYIPYSTIQAEWNKFQSSKK